MFLIAGDGCEGNPQHAMPIECILVLNCIAIDTRLKGHGDDLTIELLGKFEALIPKKEQAFRAFDRFLRNIERLVRVGVGF